MIYHLAKAVSENGDYPMDSCLDSVAGNTIDVHHGGHEDAHAQHHHGHGMMAMLATMSGKMIMGAIKSLVDMARIINPLKAVA